MSLAIFSSGYGDAAQPGRGRDHRLGAGQRGELVGRGDEGLAGELGEFGGEPLGEPGRGVQAGADRRAAGGQLVQARQRRLQAVGRGVDLGRVAGPLLADGERDGVLQVGAAGLGDVGPLPRLVRQRGVQVPELGQHVVLQRQHGGDVGRGREAVVGGLREVDVVVGVDRGLAAEGAAGQLDRAVADDLVDVHVGLRARAGLPDVEREVLVEVPGDHLGGDPGDQVGHPPRQPAGLAVDQRGGHLDVAVGVVDPLRHVVVADGEVLQRALGLGAPVLVGGDVDGPHRVGFPPRPGCFDAHWEVQDLRRCVLLLRVRHATSSRGRQNADAATLTQIDSNADRR